MPATTKHGKMASHRFKLSLLFYLPWFKLLVAKMPLSHKKFFSGVSVQVVRQGVQVDWRS